METILIISNVLLWVAVLFCLLLIVALARRVNNQLPDTSIVEQMPALEKGTSAPMFRAETLSGEMVTLDSFSQQPLVLAFISPSCEPCIEKLPALNSRALLAKQNGIQILLVSVGEKAETETFASNHNVQLPILIAPHDGNPFMHDYKVSGTPWFYFINESGVVQYGGFDLDIQLEKMAYILNKSNNASLQPASATA